MINKAKSIAKAMVTPLPVGEKWYEDRIAICETCPLNSKNVDGLSFKDKLKESVGICPEGDHCTACGCCTHRKASLKSEECGAVEIGEKPKWNRLEVKSRTRKGFKLTNLSYDVGELKNREDGKTMVYDMGETSSNRLEFAILAERSPSLDIISVDGSCSCTVGDVQVLSNSSAKITIVLSTKKFKKGLNYKRNFSIKYEVNRKEYEQTVEIKVKKL